MPEPRTPERGQASVELVALLPLIVVGLGLCWQAVLAGHAVWSAHAAARAAARAAAVQGDPGTAARGALPPNLDHRIHIRTSTAGSVTVRLHIPTILPGLDLGSVTANAHFAPQA